MLAALALGGCVQATRHSNTMVFGTNTTVGLKVGAATGEVPEILVGYDRQEAVIMPLLANTVDASASRTDTRNRLSPCRVERPLQVTGGDYAVHPCSFVAFRGNSQDSYSVLASFGAQFDASAGTDAEASGGLAQYFATGMAAQILATTGGAAVVSTGTAARQAVAGSHANEIGALITGSSRFRIGEASAVVEQELESLIVAKIRATDPNNLKQRMLAFDTAVSAGVAPLCEAFSPTQCADAVASRQYYADFDLAARPEVVRQALAAWQTP